MERQLVFYDLDENKNVIVTDEYNLDYRAKEWRIDRTIVGDYTVSTLFLGLDHRFGGKGPPILFQTMIFDRNDDDFFELGDRYCTLDGAKAGHRAMCELIRSKEKSDAEK